MLTLDLRVPLGFEGMDSGSLAMIEDQNVGIKWYWTIMLLKKSGWSARAVKIISSYLIQNKLSLIRDIKLEQS